MSAWRLGTRTILFYGLNIKKCLQHQNQKGCIYTPSNRGLIPDVYFVIGRGSKLETAALAGVRLLLSVVHPAVSDQLALLSKTLVTVGAAERLLT